MRTRWATAILALLAAGTLAAQDDQLKEIFYVPFEGSPDAVVARGMAAPFQFRVDAYEDGVVGKAARSERRYNGIRYDGRGNIDLDRGTFAFFYKPLYEPDAGEWNSLAGVSTEIEGYWAGVLEFNNKQNINRQTSFVLHFFDIGRYSPVLEFKPIFQRWKKDEWHHLALVWDRTQGITIYEDGARAASNSGRFRWDWNAEPRILVFGSWIYSTAPFALDEVHCYAECLTDEQVAALAQGRRPTGPPIPITPEAQRREADLARMGWAPDDLAQIPTAAPGQALRFDFARVTHCVDAKRLVAQPFEGLRASTWPLQKYGASTKGRNLEVHFAPGQSFDRVRIFQHRPFSGRFCEVLPGVGARRLMETDVKRPIFRGRFADMRTDAQLLLERDKGWLGQIDFYRVDPAAALPEDVLEFGGFDKLDRMPPTVAGRSALGDTPTRFDNPVRAARKAVPTWTSASPAFGGFQALTEPLDAPVAMDGVVVKLVVEGLTGPTPVQIVVKEPVFAQRDWLVADVVLDPKGPGRQSYTIHLKGRPVISFPRSEREEKGKQIAEPGLELALLVTAANPATWVMGQGGCSLGLCVQDPDRVRPIAVADQIEFAREAYAETNEGHIWDNIGPHGWGRLYYPLRWLAMFAPDERATMELCGRVRWRKEPLPYAEPKNDTGAPEWAFWQMEAMRACRKIVHWIIDNRQVETGEFGGVWGDDTDMSEYWTDYALACDDDGKVGNALRRFWKGVYRDCLVEGVSRTIRDNLHSYEEGMGAICHQLLLDYGNPVAVEHVMRAASHYYPKWMKKNDDGTYSFLSNYFGYGGVYSEGGLAEDKGVNYLMLYPAAYLTWYNRHPAATEYVLKWKRSPEVWGLVNDAYLRLRYPDAQERMQQYIEKVMKGNPSRQPDELNALLDETGVKEEWSKWLVDGAKANQWNFFAGNLPEYAGYSPRMTEYFWLAYRASGDLGYLVQSYRQACLFVNNQEWLYTVAQPSTDRIPLPRTSMIRARLGALSVTRGAGGCFWPRHALSYVKGSEQVAALVTRNTDKDLACRFHCFAEEEHALQVRVWRLLPGRYKVTLSRDKDGDGVPEEALSEREMAIERGALIDLRLPPRQGSILTFEPVDVREPQYDLPDPAICAQDVCLEYGDHLHITVHNVGTQPVKDLLVRVSDGNTGTVLGERVVPSIAAPLDLMPKTELIEIQNANAVTKGSIIIELDPEGRHPDLNRFNNRVVFEY